MVKLQGLGDDRLVLRLKMSAGNISTPSKWLHGKFNFDVEYIYGFVMLGGL